MAKVLGDLMIMIIDGYTIAGQKNGSASFSTDMLDATAKDSGGYKEYLSGWKGHTFSLENLYDPDATTNTDFSSLFAKWQAGTAVTLKWGEAVAGKKYYTASALINKVDLNGPANQLSSYSVSLQGTGTITEAVVGATSTLAEILMFSFANATESMTIVTGAGTVAVHLKSGTTITALVAHFTLSPGAIAKIGTTRQVSGITANNFTSAVTYVVTAQDGATQKTWTVTVTADL
jgi:predicted secreted protein